MSTVRTIFTAVLKTRHIVRFSLKFLNSGKHSQRLLLPVFVFFFARIAVYVYQSFGFCKQTRRSAVLYHNDTLPVKSIYIQSFGYEKRSDMYQYRAVNALNSHYVVIEWILQCFQKQQHPWRRRGYLGVLMISAANYDIYIIWMIFLIIIKYFSVLNIITI